MSNKSDAVAQLCAKIEEGGGRSAALAHKLRAWSEGEIIELELAVVFEIAVRYQIEAAQIKNRSNIVKTGFGVARLVNSSDNAAHMASVYAKENAALGAVSAALDLADCLVKAPYRSDQ